MTDHMIPNDATRAQIEAATPDQSTWLSANAGSGKTRVLTDRVARLLLGGTEPDNILCLTYTKAAASEMQNRLFKRLGAWAMMPDQDLHKSLRDIGEDRNVDLGRARTLFAAAIETPGGLKIQTIHSFCASILRRFPREAGISPLFQEMEDRAAEVLREEVLDELVGSHPDELARFAEIYTGGDIASVLATLTSKRSAFRSPQTDDALKEMLGLTHGSEAKDAIRIACIGGEAALAKTLAEYAVHTSGSYQKFAKSLSALELNCPTLETLYALFDAFLYKADHSSKSRNWPTSTHTKAVEIFAPITDDMHAWMDRTAMAYDYLCRIQAYRETATLRDFAVPYLNAYEAKKSQRAVLDFDDLIGKAKALLEDPAVAQWVLFRLDGGVDHILVDEAQDTSPDQWDIVRLLTQEFSTGEGSRPDRERTVFVVGDKKQSIYSFQGADPEGFDKMRSHFTDRLSNVQKTLYRRELQYSFRSSNAVLELVDHVFTGPMRDGIGDGIQHLAFHDALPGRVDLWPLITPPDTSEPREWDDPMDQKSEVNHFVVLARQIANEIKRLIETRETRPIFHDGTWKRQPITAGDFLILVQRRSDLFHEIIAACKSAGLEIAGADRLKLGGELAVKDISSLLRFLSLPDDDLSLAEALKSPLFGWSEKQLYDLAQPRPDGQIVWEALRKSEAASETYMILKDLRDQADFLRPFDLINRLLIKHHGRHRLLARLGHEAEDGIDALLSQALGYETSNVPSLTGFISWLQTEDVTVKRQLDSAGDRIRVMTVHGAKGLEAPIVILPDTAMRRRDIKGEFLTSGTTIFWKPKKADMPEQLSEIAKTMLDAQDRERRRLLYVALTRAEHWLIVASAGNARDHDDSWHSTISQTLDHLDTVNEQAPFGTIRRFSRNDWMSGEPVPDLKTPSQTTPIIHFPDVLPPVPVRLTTLSPSDLGGAKILPGDVDEDSSDLALARGRIIHLLMEKLPPVDPASRYDLATGLIADHADAALIPDPGSLIKGALALLDRAELNWIFQNGLPEVAVSANIPGLSDHRLSGIIDRLIVHDDEVCIIDYKTNRLVPKVADQVPVGLLRQMAAYQNAVAQIYPSKPIRTFLLWTENATLMELPPQQLSDALADVTVP